MHAQTAVCGSSRGFIKARRSGARAVSRASLAVAGTIAMVSVYGIESAHAANDVWTGATNAYLNASNWTGNNPPVSGDTLVFTSANASGPALNNNFSAGFVFGGLTFNSGSPAYTISGNSFNLSGNLNNNATALQTISAPIVLTATDTFNATSGSITLGGAISGSGGMTFSGPNTVTLSGADTSTGTFIVQGGATLAISNSSSGIALGSNNFQVGTAVGNGIVNQTAGLVSFTSASGNLMLVGNSSSTGVYNLSGGNVSTGAVSNTSRGVIIGVNTGATGVFSVSGTGILSLPSAALEVGRADSNSSGLNSTYVQTNGTAVVGSLWINGNGAYGNNSTSTFNVAGGTFTATSFSSLSGAASDTSSMFIGGTATVTLPAFPTTLGSGSTATINFNGGKLVASTASTNYLGDITTANISSGGATISTNVNITIAQNLLANASSTGGGLTKQGTGTLILTGNNTFTGAVTIGSGATSGGNADGALQITTANAIANVTNVYLTDNNGAYGTFQINGSGGNITLPSTLTLSLDANSTGATVLESIAGSNVIAGPMSDQVGGLGYGIKVDAGTLTFTGNQTLTHAQYLQGAGNGNFNGSVGGSTAIYMNGTGTWSFQGAANYTGVTQISSGTLYFGTGSTIGSNISANSIWVAGSGTLLATGPSGYTTVGNWLSSGLLSTASTGSLAATANNSENLNLSTGGYNSLYLGSTTGLTYSGTITPGNAGFFLGSPGATTNFNLSSPMVGAGLVTASGSTVNINTDISGVTGLVSAGGAISFGNTATTNGSTQAAFNLGTGALTNALVSSSPTTINMGSL
jgi:autotransporter-associated beta strand protein